MKSIDAHIHLDQYSPQVRERMLKELAQTGVERVIAVAMNLDSSKKLLQLHREYPQQVLPAFGFHPEQDLPSQSELDSLFAWMTDHRQEMAAIGEVGLPYYKRREAERFGLCFELQPYIDLLERFIALAVQLNKPIILHAVYEDADIVCALLAKYKIVKAHFHWFKGSRATALNMIDQGYFISYTPDLLYEKEIRQLAELYPIQQIMVETDGPWPFTGPFSGMETHPAMIVQTIHQLALIKDMDVKIAAQMIYENTMRFYEIEL